VKRRGSAMSDSGVCSGDMLGRLVTIQRHLAAARMKVSCIVPGLRIWQTVLLLISLVALPALSRAVSQDAAPLPTPLVEFTVQTGHTAEIQGLEYAANGKFFVSAGKDSTIKLWSPGGTLIRTIRTGFLGQLSCPFP